MHSRKSNLSLAVALALTLAASGCDDTTPPPRNTGNNSGSNPDANTRYVLLASDETGHINVLSDSASAGIAYVKSIHIENTPSAAMPPMGDMPMDMAPMDAMPADGGVLLGDVLINVADDGHARGAVVIRSGLVDDAGMPLGGGVATLDVAELVAHPDENPHVAINAVASMGEGAMPSDLNHALAVVGQDGESTHLWLMNDGPHEAPADAAAPAGSAFRFNWDSADDEDTDAAGLTDDKFGDQLEVAVGAGHKAATIAAVSATQNYIFVHNSMDHSVSVIDNVPSRVTYQQVVRTIDLGAGNEPHGIGFSSASNHVYIGIPNSSSAGLMIIDAAQEPQHMEAQFIPAGTGAAQIPASEYLSVAASGNWVFAAGYEEPKNGAVGQGFLTLINAGLADAVTSVQALGNIKPGKIEVASITVDGKDELRLFVASEEGGGDDSVVAVVDVDPETGNVLGVSALDVGPSGHSRRSAMSADSRRVYFSIAGVCGASDPANSDGEPPMTMPMAAAASTMVDALDAGHDNTEPPVDTGTPNDTQTPADPADTPDAASEAQCATIVAVDVATKTVSKPVHTVGAAIQGMAVYVVKNAATAPGSSSGGHMDMDMDMH